MRFCCYSAKQVLLRLQVAKLVVLQKVLGMLGRGLTALRVGMMSM